MVWSEIAKCSTMGKCNSNICLLHVRVTFWFLLFSIAMALSTLWALPTLAGEGGLPQPLWE